MWVTGADGSRPVQVTQLTGADVFRKRWLPDGRRLVVAAGKLSRDIVLIRSFRQADRGFAPWPGWGRF